MPGSWGAISAGEPAVMLARDLHGKSGVVEDDVAALAVAELPRSCPVAQQRFGTSNMNRRALPLCIRIVAAPLATVMSTPHCFQAATLPFWRLRPRTSSPAHSGLPGWGW